MQGYRQDNASSKGTCSASVFSCNSCTTFFVELSTAGGYSQTREVTVLKFRLDKLRQGIVCVLSCGRPAFASEYFFHEYLGVHCLSLEIHGSLQSDSGPLGLSKLCETTFLVLIELLFVSSATIVTQAKLGLPCVSFQFTFK